MISGWRIRVGLYTTSADFIRRQAIIQVVVTGAAILTLAEIEKRAILETLSRNDGERRVTAEQLGISLRTLQYRLKEYGIAGKDEQA